MLFRSFCSYFCWLILIIKKRQSCGHNTFRHRKQKLPLFNAESNCCVRFYYIKILLSSKIFYSGNFKNFSAAKSPARQQAGGAEIPSDNKENLVFSNKSEFVSETTSAQIKPFQTFSIILPNLIHQSKRKNLKR